MLPTAEDPACALEHEWLHPNHSRLINAHLAKVEYRKNRPLASHIQARARTNYRLGRTHLDLAYCSQTKRCWASKVQCLEVTALGFYSRTVFPRRLHTLAFFGWHLSAAQVPMILLLKPSGQQPSIKLTRVITSQGS